MDFSNIINFLSLFLVSFITAYPFEDVIGSGLCREEVTVRESRFIPYWETYRHKVLGLFYKIKTRLNYKTEYYTVRRTELVCCTGYESVNGICRPICLNDCHHGICVEPNVCRCMDHYTKLSSNDDACYPICTNECVHGTCVLPDVCNCDPGYTMDSDGYTCLPICNPPCLPHSTCTEPNTCTCDVGYRAPSYTQHQICEPICDNSCVNGVCIKPNECSCHSGYAPSVDDSFTCTPICEHGCAFGSCTAPNTCTCEPGYQPKSPSVCEPICSEPCVMGTCVAPESCSCNDGYGLLESSRYVCEPICENGCNNGTCTAPNICTCNEGYRVAVKNTTSEINCLPHCELLCEPYGKCVAPDVCKCNEGYQLNITYSTTADVQISQHNTSLHSPVCKPICKPACTNGLCVEPDKCNCNAGYELANDTTNVCKPVCKNCGEYGICVAPNMCKCKDGYQFVSITNDTFVCMPVCEPECGNGVCIGNNKCFCNDGYKNAKDQSTGNACIPYCKTDCTNGICVAPGVCDCNKDYMKNPETNLCEPICDNGCSNGFCVAPNQCQCNDGFVERYDEAAVICASECKRNCSGHGTCLDPELACNCFFGWSGWNCDEINVCTLSLSANDVNYNDIRSRITVFNQINSTLEDARDIIPECHSPCINFLNNETLCFSVMSDIGNDTDRIECFLSTNLACYVKDEYNTMTHTSKATAPVIGGIIFLIVCTTALGYLIVRVYLKRKTETGPIIQGSLLQETIATESLISDDGEYL